jgi:hypothetical protein
MTLSLLAAAAVQNYVWLVVCIFVFAIGYAPVMLAGGRAILAWFKRDRGFAMGIRQTGVPVGGLLGAIVLPLAASHFDGYRGALVTAAVLVGVPSLLASVFYREPALERIYCGRRCAAVLGLVQRPRDTGEAHRATGGTVGAIRNFNNALCAATGRASLAHHPGCSPHRALRRRLERRDGRGAGRNRRPRTRSVGRRLDAHIRLWSFSCRPAHFRRHRRPRFTPSGVVRHVCLCARRRAAGILAAVG